MSRATCLAVAFAILSALPALAADASLSDAVEEITLRNGLRIYVLERPFSPTFAAYYQFNVGGAMDPKGKSGIAHLLEHMMFKGSRNIGTLDPKKEARLMPQIQDRWRELNRELDRRRDPFQEADEARIEALREEIDRLTAEHKKVIVKNEYDEIMTRAGGAWMNASTGNDRTNYFIQLPSNQLELWFRVESDRLMRPVFREFYSERDVVHEERRLRTDNEATGLAWEALYGMLFRAHPYGDPVVGWSHDIEHYDREDAEQYFQTYYSPGNCVMVLVGDVQAHRVERLAEKYFGGWETQELPPFEVTAEEPQRGERRQRIEFDAEPFLMMGWRTVREGHPDQYPLDLLARILGGMASSRFNRSMVQDARIAASASCFHESQDHAGDLIVRCRPRGEHTLDELEAAVWGAIQEIQDGGITTGELERAKVASEVRRVRRLESNLWTAFSIGGAVGTTGGVAYVDQQLDRILAVTADQVADVAARYLTPSQLNVVEVISSGAGNAARSRGGETSHDRGGPPGERGAAHSKGFKKAMAMMESAPPIAIHIPRVGDDVERVVLPSGITVFLMEDHSVPAVSMSFSFLGGSNTTPVEDLAPFELAGTLLTEGGTEELSPRELEARIDELGMQFRFWIGRVQSGAHFWSLRHNFRESFGLAVDLLTRPRLDADRLEVIKGQHIEQMRRRHERPGRAARYLSHHVLFGDHPRLGRVVSRAEIEELTPDHIRAVLDRYLGADNLYVSVVGEFDRGEMLGLIEEKLGGWRRAEDSKRVWLPRPPAQRPGVFFVEKDIPQPAVCIVQEMAIDRTAPPEEHAALEIMNQILGGSGFRSRLMERLRSDEGLTYGIGSRLEHESRPGMPGRIAISYQTRRDAVAHSIDAVLEEYERICREEVSEAEVREQIQAWRNAFVFRFENEAYSVSRLRDHELDDRPYDRDSRVLEAIERVTVPDVLAVARKYLDPSRATVAVFGQLTIEDEKALGERFGITKLSREEVFQGGF